MSLKSFIGAMLTWFLGLEAGLLASHFTNRLWPIIVVGAIAVPLAAGWLCWERIALPKQRSIRRKLGLGITQLTIDSKHREVRVLLLAENGNKFSSLDLREFRGGVARLGADEVSKSLNFIATASEYHLDAPGKAKIVVWFTLNTEYLDALQGKKASCEKVFWELDTSWRLASVWGEILWNPAAACWVEVPRIGERP